MESGLWPAVTHDKTCGRGFDCRQSTPWQLYISICMPKLADMLNIIKFDVVRAESNTSLINAKPTDKIEY